jgi:hypothetical protein
MLMLLQLFAQHVCSTSLQAYMLPGMTCWGKIPHVFQPQTLQAAAG